MRQPHRSRVWGSAGLVGIIMGLVVVGGWSEVGWALECKGGNPTTGSTAFVYGIVKKNNRGIGGVNMAIDGTTTGCHSDVTTASGGGVYTFLNLLKGENFTLTPSGGLCSGFAPPTANFTAVTNITRRNFICIP